MNYTENYHLPQWEETDRVLRTDFNQMCADIEAGLDGANASAAEALESSEALMLARLRRIGYDLCQVHARSMATTKPSSTTNTRGLVYNGLATPPDRKKVSGFFLPLGGAGWLGPICGLDLNRLNDGVSNMVSASVSSSYRSATASVDISTNYSGVLNQVGVWFHQIASLSIEVSVQVKLYDLSAKAYVYTSDRIIPARLSGSETQTRMLDVAVPIEAKHSYRMELVLLAESVFMGDFGFGEEGGTKLTATVTPTYPTSGTVTETLTLDTPAMLAVGVAHYTGDTPPTMQVNGKEMVPAALRYGTDSRGSICRELEFYLEGKWSGEVKLTAFFQTEQGKTTTISDVEWYLL